jgi:rRNA-processing protein EBP2
MAKVKDRLIFENKKMEAVAQRKSNKEQKLRAKESQSNKLAEKAKKKKDHFKAVEEWAQTAAANRGRGRLADNDNGEDFFNNKASPNNKKRQFADKKYGHGGKRGRFKQNDPKALNDMSGYNRQGNFGGMGTKKSASKTGAGANRKGKRARDASRSR